MFLFIFVLFLPLEVCFPPLSEVALLRLRPCPLSFFSPLCATAHLEYCRFHDCVEGKVDYCIEGISRYKRDDVRLDVDSTVQVNP